MDFEDFDDEVILLYPETFTGKISHFHSFQKNVVPDDQSILLPFQPQHVENEFYFFSTL